MRFVALISGFLLLSLVLLDAFQTIILPRRPAGNLRITNAFFTLTWTPWRAAASLLRNRAYREHLFSVYGPLSLLILFLVWALLLNAGFALVFFGLRIPFHDAMLTSHSEWARLRSCIYVSGTTLFTLGLGDVLPQSQAARFLTVAEAGTGLGFVALVIGYVPVLYSSFSQREILVALLDARAGSPPAAGELLLRHNFQGGGQALRRLLAEWERWCAELLETHISYPILCYYRSQHDNQSWLASLTTILDTCALLIALLDGEETRQAQLTFAIGRHILVDLGHVFSLDAEEARLRETPSERLEAGEFDRLCGALRETGYAPSADREAHRRLNALRKLYEPNACALAGHLRVALPQWLPPVEAEFRKTDAWTVMDGLRSPEALASRMTRHVSQQATAVNLESHHEVSEETL